MRTVHQARSASCVAHSRGAERGAQRLSQTAKMRWGDSEAICVPGRPEKSSENNKIDKHDADQKDAHCKILNSTVCTILYAV